MLTNFYQLFIWVHNHNFNWKINEQLSTINLTITFYVHGQWT